MCKLLVGLPDVNVLAVDDQPDGPIVVHIEARPDHVTNIRRTYLQAGSRRFESAPIHNLQKCCPGPITHQIKLPERAAEKPAPRSLSNCFSTALGPPPRADGQGERCNRRRSKLARLKSRCRARARAGAVLSDGFLWAVTQASSWARLLDSSR